MLRVCLWVFVEPFVSLPRKGGVRRPSGPPDSGPQPLSEDKAPEASTPGEPHRGRGRREVRRMP